MHYGKRRADVILSTVGNIMSGQVTGESAHALSERFGKIPRDRESLSINSSDASVNRSKQLDYAIPQSTISGPSSGEFVGMVADNPDQWIPQKMFHAEFHADFKALAKEQIAYPPLPQGTTNSKAMGDNYLKIKQEIKTLIEDEMEKLMNTPGMEKIIISK